MLSEIQEIMKPGLSVIITNYNGREYIGDCIDHVEQAAKAYGGPIEIILVDDASPGGDAEYLRKNFPQCSLIALDKNLGYSGANNTGVKQSNHDIVLTLNSDMLLEKDFFIQVIQQFNSDSIFAVAAQCVGFESGRYEGGCNGFGFYHGNFLPYQEDVELRNKTKISSHAGGGSTYRKDLFLKFGGYSELYSPFYWEDVDLSITAFLHGYRVVYEAACRIRHKHRGAIRSHFQDSHVRTIQTRNRNLFLWKFTKSFSRMRLKHYFWIPLLILGDLLTGQLVELKGFYWALLRLPELLREKKIVPRSARIEEVLFYINRDRCKLQFHDEVWIKKRQKQYPNLLKDRWVQLALWAGTGKRILSVYCPAFDFNQYIILNRNTVTIYQQSGKLLSTLDPQVEDTVKRKTMDLIFIGDHPSPFDAVLAFEPLLHPQGKFMITIHQGASELAHVKKVTLDRKEIIERAEKVGFEIEDIRDNYLDLSARKMSFFLIVLRKKKSIE